MIRSSPDVAFKYRPLENPREIRLLKVAADENSEKFHVMFTHVSLDSLPTYNAISYFWGDSTPNHKIWFGKNQFLGVNSAAASILRSAATSKSESYLWIDALCINQQDNDEKNVQVPLMGYIYSSAKKVIAWLGDPTPDSEMAMNFTVTLFNAITEVFRRQGSATTTTLLQQPAFLHPSPNWTALGNFLNRPWFRRVWIIQEVVLAREILLICGDSSLNWQSLAAVITIISGNGLGRLLRIETEGSQPIQSSGIMNLQVSYSMRVLRDRGESAELHFNLLQCYQFEATNPRDHVYALLGMTTDLNELILDVDYDAKTQEVFTITATQILAKGTTLDILHAAGIRHPRTFFDLPSWVPDWSCIPRTTIFGAIASNMGYKSSGTSSIQLSIDAATTELKLTGRLTDTIKTIFPHRPSQPIQDSLRATQYDRAALLSWFTTSISLASSLHPYPSGTPWAHAFWRTLIGNISYATGPGTPVPPENYEHFRSFLALLTAFVQSPDPDGPIAGTSAEMARGSEAFVTAMAMVGERRLFVTGMGHLGLGPPCAVEGDEVCVFWGAATPFVVRPGPKENAAGGRWLLVGECYIDGLMSGEALTMGEDNDLILI